MAPPKLVIPPRQRPTKLIFQPLSSGGCLIEVDAGDLPEAVRWLLRTAKALEVVDEILGASIARRARRVWTAAHTAQRAIKLAGTKLLGRVYIDERRATGVMEVQRDGLERYATSYQHFQDLTHLHWVGHAGRIAEGDHVCAGLQQGAR